MIITKHGQRGIGMRFFLGQNDSGIEMNITKDGRRAIGMRFFLGHYASGREMISQKMVEEDWVEILPSSE